MTKQNEKIMQCKMCGGRGYNYDEVYLKDGYGLRIMDCYDCKGTGKVKATIFDNREKTKNKKLRDMPDKV